MGTKYTSVSASGYDSSPPPDDGTVSEANRGKWSTIKSKLTNVLKTFIEGVNSGLVTALDTSPRSLSASGSTASTDHWKTIEVVSASVVVTLAAASSMAAGYIVNVANQSSGNITVACQTTDTIDTVTATTQTIPAKGCREYIVNTAATGYITKCGNTVETNPTRTVLTSGTGTYVTPTNCRRIWIRMIGGGGGGSGGGGDGADGTASTWSGSSLSAGGGAKAVASAGGAGGAASNGDVNIPGATGNPASDSVANGNGGTGGGSPFGGAGAAGKGNAAGAAAGGAGSTNSGGGGGGGGAGGGTTAKGGGGSGGYLEKTISAPATTYTYTVGASGAAGTGGASQSAGGAGAAGIIIVEEYY